MQNDLGELAGRSCCQLSFGLLDVQPTLDHSLTGGPEQQ